MKKLNSILLISLLLLTLLGCKNKAPNNFTLTKIENKHLELQTPNTWLYMNPEGTKELLDMVVTMIEEGAFSQEVLDEIKKGEIVMFMEMDANNNPTGRNMTIIEAYVGAATQDDLPALAAYMETEYLKLGEAQGLNSVVWIEKPTVVELGANRFMLMAIRYTMLGLESVVYQGISINRENSYTFTYTVNSTTHSKETQELFKKILATVVFN